MSHTLKEFFVAGFFSFFFCLFFALRNKEFRLLRIFLVGFQVHVHEGRQKTDTSFLRITFLIKEN